MPVCGHRKVELKISAHLEANGVGLLESTTPVRLLARQRLDMDSIMRSCGQLAME